MLSWLVHDHDHAFKNIDLLCSLFHMLLDERRFTPWVGHHFIGELVRRNSRPFALTFIPVINL